MCSCSFNKPGLVQTTCFSLESKIYRFTSVKAPWGNIQNQNSDLLSHPSVLDNIPLFFSNNERTKPKWLAAMIGLKVRSVGKSFVGCSLAGKWRIPCVSISCISRKITNTFQFVVLSSHTSYVYLHLATWQKRFFAFLSFHSCTNIFILFKNVRYIPFVSIQVASMLLFVWKAKNNVSFSGVSDLKC